MGLTTHFLQIFLLQLTTDFFGCWDFFVLINSSQGHDEGTSRSNPCSRPQVDQCCRSRAPPSKGSNVRLFSDIFFLSPEVVSLVWEDLREVIEIHDDDFAGRCTVVHFLWTLYFYKTYNTWDHCAKFVGVCKQTYMEYVSKMTEFLQHIYDNEVSHFTFVFFIHDWLSFLTITVFLPRFKCTTGFLTTLAVRPL